MKDKEIVNKSLEIIETIGEAITVEKIRMAGMDINHLAQVCRKTKIFQEAQSQIDEFKDFHNGRSVDNKVLHSYIQLLDKIGNAPTNLHMVGSIILLVPVIDDFLHVSEGQGVNQ